MEHSTTSRRPLKVRQRPWAIATAAWLARRGVPPRLISITSLFAAASGAAFFLVAGKWNSPVLQSLSLILAAAMMQVRLLCNLLDGMVAVEGHLKTPDGELYNDLPDRFSDWCLLVAVGYSLHRSSEITVGWCAAMLSVSTAYVRVLGKACGATMHFEGPMAKQQRMALLCAACLIGALLTPWNWQVIPLTAALWIIVVGSIWTIICRLRFIAAELNRVNE